MFVILGFVVGFFVGCIIWSLVVEKGSSVPSVPVATPKVKGSLIPPPVVLKCRECGETEGKRGPFKTQKALKAHMARCRGWP